MAGTQDFLTVPDRIVQMRQFLSSPVQCVTYEGIDCSLNVSCKSSMRGSNSMGRFLGPYLGLDNPSQFGSRQFYELYSEYMI